MRTHGDVTSDCISILYDIGVIHANFYGQKVWGSYILYRFKVFALFSIENNRNRMEMLRFGTFRIIFGPKLLINAI